MKNRLCLLALLLAAFPVAAQNSAQGQQDMDSLSSPASMGSAVDNEQGDVPADAPVEMEVVSVKSVAPVSIPSLLFNYWEQTAINEAKKSAASGGFKRDVTEDEISRAMDAPLDQERPKPPPEEREIKLGGILFTTQNDWTIWLNGQRVTPDALPKEIIDLRVYKHYIDMKWQDEYTRRLYPIRLRAHQRFNLDNRMFLPG